MLSEVIISVVVFVVSCAIGINIIEMLTATTLIRADPVNHASRERRLNKTILHLTIKNSIYLVALLLLFVISLLEDPGRLNILFFIFTIVMLGTLIVFSILNPYYVDSVRAKKTRMGRSLVFNVKRKKERRIIRLLRVMRRINFLVSVMIIVVTAFMFLVV